MTNSQEAANDETILKPTIASNDSDSIEADLTGTFEEHWRKGIPTLVLILLAACIACYYWALIRPSIQKRYAAVIQANLTLLGAAEIDAEGLSKYSNPDLSPKKRIEILKETQLALRRLVGWNPTDDSLHYRYAIVSNSLSSSYQSEAQMKGAEYFLGMAKTEQQNATGAMERVRKLNRSMSPKASLWLIQEKLEDSLSIPNSELLVLEKSLLQLVEVDSIASSAKTVLAQVGIERALRLSSKLECSKRLEILADADQLLRNASTDDLKSLSLQAEAIAIVDSEKGRENANKALQIYWSTREAAKPSADSLAGVFRCLLIIDSLKEAQVFLTEQLQQIAVTDQTKLRTFTAAAALRHVVAGAVWECAGATTSNASSRRKGANYPARADVVFSLAIQLSPESPELIFWLQALSNRDNSDPTVSWLRKELASDWTAINRARGNTISAETGLRTFLTALDGLGREELDDTTKKSLVAAIKLSPAFGLAASRLAFQMAGSKIIQLETGLRWLEIITSESPDILAAWSDRANLYLQNKQPAEAIKCLESLLEKLPNNAQIQEALEAAKSQLKIAE